MLADVFGFGMRVGAFAHAIAHLRQRDFLPERAVPDFHQAFATRQRCAVAQTVDT